MAALSALDLELFLRKYAPVSWAGVYSYDDFTPRKAKHLPISLIVNTRPSSDPMGHWIAMYVDENYNGYFLDSFGVSPFGKYHNFLAKNASHVYYNTLVLQFNQYSCGQHCAYFICQMSSGRTFEEILNIYKLSKCPDDLVNAFFKARRSYISHLVRLQENRT